MKTGYYKLFVVASLELFVVAFFKKKIHFRHWLYGEKILKADVKVFPRGWFPRRCAVELINNDCDFPRMNTKKQD